MLREATKRDLSAIVELFGRANDAPYDLAKVAEEKCFGAGASGAPEVRIHGDFAGVSVTCGKALRILVVDRKNRRRGIGTALLRDAESRGVSTAAAEAGNYFTPGIVSTDAAALAFFRTRGYEESASTHNLETTALPSDPNGGATRAAAGDRERVLRFIEREFGSIWRFEAGHAFDADPVTLYFVEEAGHIAGFAAHDVNNRGLGFFGPTGVAKALRGRGIGSRLLQASLADLRRLGHGRAVIPWTDAIEFYRKSCGAEVTHRFIVMRRKSDPLLHLSGIDSKA